jgi:hypothetical protein
MEAAAHTKGGYGGVPQSVGKDFNEADKGPGILKKKMRSGKPAKELMYPAHSKKAPSDDPRNIDRQRDMRMRDLSPVRRGVAERSCNGEGLAKS